MRITKLSKYGDKMNLLLKLSLCNPLARLKKSKLLCAGRARGRASMLPRRSAGAQAADTELKIGSCRHPAPLDPITGRVGYDHAFLYPAFGTLIGMRPK